MSDLIDKIKWAKENDKKCQKIATRATNFVLKNLMTEDLYEYLYRVLMRHSSLEKSINFQELLEETKNDSNWIEVL
jgi:hypothetical protein